MGIRPWCGLRDNPLSLQDSILHWPVETQERELPQVPVLEGYRWLRMQHPNDIKFVLPVPSAYTNAPRTAEVVP